MSEKARLAHTRESDTSNSKMGRYDLYVTTLSVDNVTMASRTSQNVRTLSKSKFSSKKAMALFERSERSGNI